MTKSIGSDLIGGNPCPNIGSIRFYRMGSGQKASKGSGMVAGTITEVASTILSQVGKDQKLVAKWLNGF